MKYKDPKELIGLEIMEGEKLYKITGIGEITDEYMTIYTEPINIIEKEFGFDKAFEYILLVEGGYSNDKHDKGGKTMYGIIESEARKYGYKGEMNKMPKSIAEDIYKKKYWTKNNLDKIKDFRVALSIFDWTVNSGNWGTKKAQTPINKIYGKKVLTVDGIIGTNSLKYLNEVDPEEFLKVYHELQRAFYTSIVDNNPSQKVFLKGWFNRVSRKENFIKNL